MVILLAPDERASGVATIKDLRTGKQVRVSTMTELISTIKQT